MTTELTLTEKKQKATEAMVEIRSIIANRKDPVIINKKRYLEFRDWQLIGMAFGITSFVLETLEIFEDTQKPLIINADTGERQIITFKETIGFKARAVAMQDGKQISAAEAECLFNEPNWKSKPRFTLRSMAQTRACAKALRNCLSWVLDYADYKGNFAADASAEEIG